MIPLQKLPNNVCNLGKLIVSTSFEKLPKMQLIAQSGHTESNLKFSLQASALEGGQGRRLAQQPRRHFRSRNGHPRERGHAPAGRKLLR